VKTKPIPLLPESSLFGQELANPVEENLTKLCGSALRDPAHERIVWTKKDCKNVLTQIKFAFKICIFVSLQEQEELLVVICLIEMNKKNEKKISFSKQYMI